MLKITPGNIRITFAPPVPPMPIKTAARILGVSATPLRKGLAAGVIPDLSLTNVDKLSRLGILDYVESATGAPTPVLRLAPAQPAEDAPEAPERKFTGYQHGMTDTDFLSSTDRWWNPAGRNLIEAAESMLIACGGIVIGWADIKGVLDTDVLGQLWYDCTIVARLESAPDRTIRLLDPTSPNAAIADAVLGRRVLGGQGGSIRGLTTPGFDPSAE